MIYEISTPTILQNVHTVHSLSCIEEIFFNTLGIDKNRSNYLSGVSWAP